MFLLCAAFFTLSEAICDPAGAMLAQTLHPQGAIVALETSAGSHLGLAIRDFVCPYCASVFSCFKVQGSLLFVTYTIIQGIISSEM